MIDKRYENMLDDEVENVSYVFPTSEEIVIQKSDLHIQLEKFKERISSSFSIYDLLALLSVWVTLVSADFKSIFSISTDEVKAGYFVFVIIITLLIIYSRSRYLFFNSKDKDTVSDSPEKMAVMILDQCKSKPKKNPSLK